MHRRRIGRSSNDIDAVVRAADADPLVDCIDRELRCERDIARLRGAYDDTRDALRYWIRIADEEKQTRIDDRVALEERISELLYYINEHQSSNIDRGTTDGAVVGKRRRRG